MLFTLLSSTQNSAYTDALGIQVGDIVDLDYVGTFENGTEFDSGNMPNAKMEQGNFIDGFFYGILGMKVGQRKTINVPPDQGYTDPNDPRTGHLAGKTLIFEVTIKKIVINANTNANNPVAAKKDSGEGAASKIWDVLKWVLGIGATIVVMISLQSIMKKQTTPGCIHCKSLGKSQISEGKCGSCGNTYCRNSFSRGCPNCKSNTFIPYS